MVVEVLTDRSTLENCLALSTKNSILLGKHPRKMSVHVECIYKNVHSGVIHNSPKVKTNQMSINSKMDKLWCYSFTSILQSNEKELTITRLQYMDVSPEHDVE